VPRTPYYGGHRPPYFQIDDTCVMGDKKKDQLKNYLQQRLADTWVVILATLAIFFLSAYLPPPLKFLLWAGLVKITTLWFLNPKRAITTTGGWGLT
jgi:hypothetical protein